MSLAFITCNTYEPFSWRGVVFEEIAAPVRRRNLATLLKRLADYGLKACPGRDGLLAFRWQLSPLAEKHRLHERLRACLDIVHPAVIAVAAYTSNLQFSWRAHPASSLVGNPLLRYLPCIFLNTKRAARVFSQNWLHPIREDVFLSERRRATAEDTGLVSHSYPVLDGRQEDTEDPKGLRDTDTDAGRVLRQSEEDCQAGEALNSPLSLVIS